MDSERDKMAEASLPVGAALIARPGQQTFPLAQTAGLGGNLGLLGFRLCTGGELP